MILLACYHLHRCCSGVGGLPASYSDFHVDVCLPSQPCAAALNSAMSSLVKNLTVCCLELVEPDVYRRQIPRISRKGDGRYRAASAANFRFAARKRNRYRRRCVLRGVRLERAGSVGMERGRLFAMSRGTIVPNNARHRREEGEEGDYGVRQSIGHRIADSGSGRRYPRHPQPVYAAVPEKYHLFPIIAKHDLGVILGGDQCTW